MTQSIIKGTQQMQTSCGPRTRRAATVFQCGNPSENDTRRHFELSFFRCDDKMLWTIKSAGAPSLSEMTSNCPQSRGIAERSNMMSLCDRRYSEGAFVRSGKSGRVRVHETAQNTSTFAH